MPIQAPQWTDYLNCPACCREFSPRRSPVSLSCGHTLCRPCLKNLIRKQCPFDQNVISMDLEELVVNTALLQLMGYDPPTQPFHPSSIQSLSEQDRRAYDVIVKCLEQLAVFLKYCCTASVNMIGNRLSRPMQRKLVTLLQCSLMDEEGRGKAARAARSLGERTVSELILQHQNPQQLSANLWAAVRSRGCQFLGPAMQEEVLKLVLLALEDGSPLSRKVLVMFVVQRLEPHFPQASKTSIGHVVQLLYRASCFKVSKRESDSSLMQLKEEFRTYESLRREHDAQIVQIATESGLRIAPDQWSALLYGDTIHKSHMQSIIDKLQTPHSFAQSVQELFFALQRTGDPAQLLVMSISLDRLTNIDPSPDAKSPSWQELSQIMTSLKDVVSGLVDYMQHHAAVRDANHNLKTDRMPDATTQTSTVPNLLPGRYKVAMCRDAQTRTFCPRGNNCTYAHTEEELERHRRQDNQGAPPPGYPTLPQQRPYNQYALPAPENNNFIRMPMQQVSPSGRPHGMPENNEAPDEFEFGYARRRASYERHQFDMAPSNNPNPNPHRSYANAVMYGAANNRQSQNRNGGVSPLDVGIRPPIRVMSPQGPIPHLGGVRSPLNGNIQPLLGIGPDGGLIVLNENMGLFRNFSPLGDARNNGSLQTDDPPTDSRYFAHQPSVQPAYYQPQNDIAQMAAARPMPMYQGLGAVGPLGAIGPVGAAGPVGAFGPVGVEYPRVFTPEYSQQMFVNLPELPTIESFGGETRSRFETVWQHAPSTPEAPPRTRFMFNSTAKNLPEGLKPYDELPEGFCVRDHVHPQHDMDDQDGFNPLGVNNNPMANDQHPPAPAVAAPAVPEPAVQAPDAAGPVAAGPPDTISEDEELNKEKYTQLATNALLADLHNLAVYVTSQCSDDTDDISDLKQE